MSKDEALKMAIEALKDANDTIASVWRRYRRYDEALNACKEALKHPARPLSDDEINAILVKHGLDNVEMAGNHIDVVLLMRDVERAHEIGVVEYE